MTKSDVKLVGWVLFWLAVAASAAVLGAEYIGWFTGEVQR